MSSSPRQFFNPIDHKLSSYVETISESATGAKNSLVYSLRSCMPVLLLEDLNLIDSILTDSILTKLCCCRKMDFANHKCRDYCDRFSEQNSSHE